MISNVPYWRQIDTFRFINSCRLGCLCHSESVLLFELEPTNPKIKRDHRFESWGLKLWFLQVQDAWTFVAIFCTNIILSMYNYIYIYRAHWNSHRSHLFLSWQQSMLHVYADGHASLHVSPVPTFRRSPNITKVPIACVLYVVSMSSIPGSSSDWPLKRFSTLSKAFTPCIGEMTSTTKSFRSVW